MRLGILGGTFDPVHIGHLILAETARTGLALERVVFVPAGNPWRKEGREVTAAEHRLAMTRLAIADNNAFTIDDREVRHKGPSYTVETLTEMRRSLPEGSELYFIVGADALADMVHWRDPTGIARQAMVAVAPRQGSDLEGSSLPFPSERLVRVDMPYVGISSTWLRERARQRLSLRYLVPEAVEAYIREHGLYVAS